VSNINVFSVRIAYDKGSGRSRGFGFVDFAEEGDALSAKDAMDGKVKPKKEKNLCCYHYEWFLKRFSLLQGLLGRPLRISFALERVRGGPVVVPRLGKSKRERERVFK